MVKRINTDRNLAQYKYAWLYLNVYYIKNTNTDTEVLTQYTHIHTYTYTHTQKQSPIDRQNIVEAFVFIILIPIIPNYKYPCVCASGALGICAFVAVFVGFYSHHHQLHRHEWKDNESPAGFFGSKCPHIASDLNISL